MVFEKQKDSFHSEVGQILLIVILVVIVALTVGLSVLSRSITSQKSSTEEAESQKALSAAEAGIERAIQGSVPVSISATTLTNNSSYATSYAVVNSSNFLINGGNVISKDEGADVWFVDHDSSNLPIYSQAKSAPYFNLYWGSTPEVCGTSTAPAAIEVIAVTRDVLSPYAIKSYRYAFDGCSRGNNFTQADNAGGYTISGISGTFKNRTPETGTNSDLVKGVSNIVLLRVIPIYKDAVVAISACDHAGNNCISLPTQGYAITSTGISGQASRKLTVFKGWPQTYLPYLSNGLFVAN